jgi:cysteine synthase
LVAAKVESFNPGASVKDRIGLALIQAGEREGKLKPGGTIVEPTSGNTGLALAMAAALRGYKLICTAPDKISKEKMSLLRAFGAKVITCPTNVEADDPRSYYKVAERIRDDEGAYLPYQYYNPANPEAHYATTGPEIWKQTDGKVTHWVAGVGTGGTIGGTAKYLKEQNPAVRVIGVDTVGSVYAYYKAHGKLRRRSDPPVPDRRDRRRLPPRHRVVDVHRRDRHDRRQDRLPRGLRAGKEGSDLGGLFGGCCGGGSPAHRLKGSRHRRRGNAVPRLRRALFIQA